MRRERIRRRGALAALAAIAMFAGAAIGASSAVAETVPEAVDSADPAITYTGTWQTYTSPNDIGGSRVVGRTAGATATIPFEATRVQVIGAKASNLGKMEVAIDGAVVATVDLYSSSGIAPAVVFDSGPLEPGPHTMTLRVTGEKHPAASGFFIPFDALVFGSRLRLPHDAELSDDALFAALDLDRPGLEAVSAASTRPTGRPPGRRCPTTCATAPRRGG
ncbi:hypothetical protein [Conexibacter arvalis]|uniref:Carbohydrate esterase 2 N-terminal domain-containing protein n=1 Tax=Conexibacter arvalis TaxID=912552 RepID=A0A840I7R9_9ACTN|nr:hypothetical protein [Conexibacter arvalis]MBB4660939.1 hypothetical protein [Conexibacter arvalis]